MVTYYVATMNEYGTRLGERLRWKTEVKSSTIVLKSLKKSYQQVRKTRTESILRHTYFNISSSFDLWELDPPAGTIFILF